MNKPILILMVGLSGSGKSTKAKELARKYNATIISSDNIRAELYDVNDQTHNDKVFSLLHKRVRNSLKDNKNVIVDATNLTIKSRRQFLTYDAVKVTYIMRTPYEECIKRDLSRDRSVGKNVIESQMAKFQIPFEVDFHQIIFDEDNAICINRNIYEDIDNQMKGFDQKNPHHKYDLLTHCKICDKTIDSQGGNIIDCCIGDWHDYGKLFTQTIDENGIAHYYGHHNVGSYMLMSNDNWFAYTSSNIGMNRLKYILTIINYHMLPFTWKEEKTKEKYKKIFGDYYYNVLTNFNRCDKIANGMEV